MTTSPTYPAILEPHTKDLGGFQVRRLLPAYPREMIGPFIFFDHMGPARFPPVPDETEFIPLPEDAGK